MPEPRSDQQERIAQWATHPILRTWIRPEYLDPRGLRERACAAAHVRYVVADQFFREDALERLVSAHETLAFRQDDVGLNYDSQVCRATPENVGADLFFCRAWQDYAAFVVDVSLAEPGKTYIKLRRHPAYARGFWIHTDLDTERSKAMAILGYFNRGWTAEHGGLLQLWRAFSLAPEDAANGIYQWQDFQDRPLDFLGQGPTLRVTVAGAVGLIPAEVVLLDEIVPAYNRVVFCSFQFSPAFHSITPSRGRERKNFVQWLY